MRIFLLLLVITLCGCHKQPLSVIVSGDTAGWIVPCGCTSNQSGGLPRRGTFVKQRQELGPVIVVEVGGAPSGTTLYDKLKFEAILQGEIEMGIAAHNIGQAEAELGIDELRKWKVPWISANTTDATGQPLAEPARIVQRILFVGVLSQKFQTENVHVLPPQQAVLKTLKTHAGYYDYVFVLAYMPEDELLQLAENLPEVDAVIGGPTGQPIPPQTQGHTLLVSSTRQGKFLALLTVPAKKSEKIHAEIIELNERFADDPVQQENVQKFYAELKRRDLAPTDTPFIDPHRVLVKTSDFAGPKSCQNCHEQEYRIWKNSRHAQAWQSLLPRDAQYDPECQRCHVTGYALPDGFETASRSEARYNVGCESCHGPAAEHNRKTTLPLRRSKEHCRECHDHENSPNFDMEMYWEKINHTFKEP